MNRRRCFSLLCILLGSTDTGLAGAAPDSWWQSGRNGLAERLAVEPDNRPARNVILFIGDGMGISTITAARIFEGQRLGLAGEEHRLAFDRFPHTALIKTYNTDAQVPDSAGTASAMATGVKTRIGAIAVAEKQTDTCFGPERVFPRSIIERAEYRGMATGLVSTARITHATPAAFYSHTPSRDWEDDSDLPDRARQNQCLDIARQLVEFDRGDGIDLVLGGGRANFLPENSGGRRHDKRNLLQQWQQARPGRTLLHNVQELRKIEQSPGQVLGLFNSSHMAYEADRDNNREPSLAEMTRFAINRLARHQKGYFLMVEGARIDHAHHRTNAYRALSDASAFAAAVAEAVALTDPKETLILVTADHSHVFTMAGYPRRGNPILGLVENSSSAISGDSDRYQLGSDGKPYTTLGYYTGSHSRQDNKQALTSTTVADRDYRQQSAVPMSTETHGGEDVALFARGPRAYLVGGVLEQHVIFHLMAHALDWNLERPDTD